MNLEKFSELVGLVDLKELERCLHIVFYLTWKQPEKECDIQSVLEVFRELHFSQPNATRLKKNIAKDSRFIRASSKDRVRLHARSIKELQQKYPTFATLSEEIQANPVLIPDGIFDGPPTYIARLVQQINASFEQNIFDGCAVLMRRLLEILLIQSYVKIGIDNEIRGPNDAFMLLEGISNNAKTNSTLSLSRSSKVNLDAFRTLGNFAAHRIEYSTRKFDIEKVAHEYRATVEELAYKSGHKN